MTDQYGKPKKVPDSEIYRLHRDKFDRAYQAVWFFLSEDRRFLGAPVFKDLICQVAALRALGSESTIYKQLSKVSRGGDQLGIDMITEGYNNACRIAKETLK